MFRRIIVLILINNFVAGFWSDYFYHRHRHRNDYGSAYYQRGPPICKHWCQIYVYAHFGFTCCIYKERPGVCPNQYDWFWPVYPSLTNQYYCFSDDFCPIGFKCCYDVCFGLKVCKPSIPEAIPIATIPPTVTTIHKSTPAFTTTTQKQSSQISIEDVNILTTARHLIVTELIRMNPSTDLITSTSEFGKSTTLLLEDSESGTVEGSGIEDVFVEPEASRILYNDTLIDDEDYVIIY